MTIIPNVLPYFAHMLLYFQGSFSHSFGSKNVIRPEIILEWHVGSINEEILVTIIYSSYVITTFTLPEGLVANLCGVYFTAGCQ